MSGLAKNTDREIWRAIPGDYYSPLIHVTKDGRIGINVAGHVIVLDVREWHLAGRQGLEPKRKSDYVTPFTGFGPIPQSALDEIEAMASNPEMIAASERRKQTMLQQMEASFWNNEVNGKGYWKEFPGIPNAASSPAATVLEPDNKEPVYGIDWVPPLEPGSVEYQQAEAKAKRLGPMSSEEKQRLFADPLLKTCYKIAKEYLDGDVPHVVSR